MTPCPSTGSVKLLVGLLVAGIFILTLAINDAGEGTGVPPRYGYCRPARGGPGTQ